MCVRFNSLFMSCRHNYILRVNVILVYNWVVIFPDFAASNVECIITQECLNGEFVRVGPNPKFSPVAGYHWYGLLNLKAILCTRVLHNLSRDKL